MKCDICDKEKGYLEVGICKECEKILEEEKFEEEAERNEANALNGFMQGLIRTTRM